MHRESTGDLVVLDAGGKPAGMLSDRDIICRSVAAGLLPEVTRIGEILTKNIRYISGKLGVYEAAVAMQRYGVRQLPVTTDDGCLAGICTLDDLLRRVARKQQSLCEEICMLTDVPVNGVNLSDAFPFIQVTGRNYTKY